MLIFRKEALLDNHEEVKSSGNNCHCSHCQVYDRTIIVCYGEVRIRM
jgi:hypothetical protein